MSLKRMESRKPHSWWWDSYISPKNSRWLSDNLEEMEQAVKKMMKLIEEDADSFAKKAEMYYRKRPELISHVEEFYRRYRSLAERYDHLTGDLKKNIANDLQSHSSGFPEIAVDAPAPDLKLARRRSGQQAAGFDFFLGSGSSSDNFNGDESSCLTDSEADFDSSSVYNGGDHGSQARIIELETELHELKERMKLQQEEISENVIAKYEIELRAAEEKTNLAEEKTNLAEEEISRLKEEVKLYESQISDPDSLALVEEVKGLKSKLHDSRIEILSLKQELEEGVNTVKSVEKSKQNQMMEQLEAAVRDAASWKTKFNAERREVGKLQERMLRLKASLSGRDQEIRELKLAVSDAEEKIFPEKAQIKSEISKLIEERGSFEAQNREWETQCRQLKTELSGQEQSFNDLITEKDSQLENLREKLDELRNRFEEEISSKDDEIGRISTQMNLLRLEYDEMMGLLMSRIDELKEEIEKQRKAISEEKREAIRQLCFSLEYYRNEYDELRCSISSRKQHRRHAIAA